MSLFGNNGWAVGRKNTPTTGSASGIWVPNEQSLAKRAAIWPSADDEYFSSVSLLLHMDGSNGSTTFTDSSSNALTVTANGNAQISTAQSKFGGSSGAFDGTGDKISFPEITFAGDFTIECHFYASNITVDSCLFGASSGNVQILRFNQQNLIGSLMAYANGYYMFGQLNSYLTGLQSNTWYHIALVRSSSIVNVYINGVRKTPNTDTFTGTFTVSLAGAGYQGTDQYWNGHIDEVRFTQAARYTANFTPPSVPYLNS